MKYVMLIGDGMGDYPIPELGGQTPLEAARTPHLDRLAQESLVGLARTIPPGMEPGSDVANLSLLGYDPARFHTGRAPLEAASLNIPLSADQVAFRCNLVVLGRDQAGRPTMADYCSGHIPTQAARPFVLALQAALSSERFSFHPGTSYRHLFVWTGGRENLRLTPPHDLSGQAVQAHLDRLREESPELFGLTEASWRILAQVPDRPGLEVRPTSIWLWGQGRPPRLTTYAERFGVSGGVISAVDLLKGLAAYAGLKPIAVPGATGWLDTNYAGKVEAALDCLAQDDFVFLHLEAPDEAGHSGVLADKIKAIEAFDAHIVGPMLSGLERYKPFRLLAACDHFTPLSVLTHTPEAVPALLFDSRRPLGHGSGLTERAAAQGPDLGPGHGLILRLLDK